MISGTGMTDYNAPTAIPEPRPAQQELGRWQAFYVQGNFTHGPILIRALDWVSAAERADLMALDLTYKLHTLVKI